MPFSVRRCRGPRESSADPARGDHSLAFAEDRPAFQEVDHLLDSALARSRAAAVQTSDRQADHASACWEDRVRWERLDRGAVPLDLPGSRTWAPCFSPRNCTADAYRTSKLPALKRAGSHETDPLRASFRKFRGFCLLR